MATPPLLFLVPFAGLCVLSFVGMPIFLTITNIILLSQLREIMNQRLCVLKNYRKIQMGTDCKKAVDLVVVSIIKVSLTTPLIIWLINYILDCMPFYVDFLLILLLLFPETYFQFLIFKRFLCYICWSIN